MKRIAILLVLFGIWNNFDYGEVANAADFALPDAVIQTFAEKPNAPDFAIEDVEGRQVKLKDYRDKTVLLFFWATW